MTAQKKLALGSVLAVMGGAGMVLAIMFGWTSLARPWGFLLGLATGICAGLGCALAISGMLQKKSD